MDEQLRHCATAHEQSGGIASVVLLPCCLDALGDPTAGNIENPSSTVTRAHSANVRRALAHYADSGPSRTKNTSLHRRSTRNSTLAFPTARTLLFLQPDDPLKSGPLTDTVFNWGETKTMMYRHDSPLTFEGCNGIPPVTSMTASATSSSRPAPTPAPPLHITTLKTL